MVNPCNTSPCQNGATCVPDLLNYKTTCECDKGYIGEFCEIGIKKSFQIKTFETFEIYV